ncbi:6-carboxytetrahydropterin synthase [uncultured Paludibaculum sp.]|uniref:6-carboxytetrahydropterin synthase n=1 Tax=uncultured Paludibaculum sp. TaxID=1765020 RepID=UPI002AAA77AE|nr:6-carboxytetrahydropterin synthase [uncultured Paludibaculum sp.]
MPDIRLVRRYRFSASHRLHTPLLSDEENRAVYGKCNNPYGHGHDYTLDVYVQERVDPARGRAVSVDALDLFIDAVVLKPFDRRNLNVEVAEFATLVPTTEVLAEVLARRLAAAWPIAFAGLPARFEKLRIWETKRNIFEVLAPVPAPRESHRDEIIESCSQGS